MGFNAEFKGLIDFFLWWNMLYYL